MKVQELLDCEDKWTQSVPARNKEGELTWYDSPDAVKWCLIGAIHKCYSSEGNRIITKIKNANIDPVVLNDTHSYEEVMELVRRLDI